MTKITYFSTLLFFCWIHSSSQYQITLQSTNDRFINFTETTGGLNIEMIAVKGGTFRMGCTGEQGRDCFDNETPVHNVSVSDFYIGKYEVTQLQWKAVMGNNPSRFRGDNLPVENVSWNDVQTFIIKLNALTGKQFCLPTEAEWEFAARGGNNSRGYKYSGSNSVENVAWYDRNSSDRTHEAGTKLPNELGIYDMSGNVNEWCNDNVRSYNRNDQTNPYGGDGSYRAIIRGGSWYESKNKPDWEFSSGERFARVSCRRKISSDQYADYVGFRLAISKATQIRNENERQKIEEQKRIREEQVEKERLERQEAQRQRSLEEEYVNLAGRTLSGGRLPMPTFVEMVEGRIVIIITVNPNGDVISAEIGQGTNIDNAATRSSALDAAKRAKFNKINPSSNDQSGTITYTFSSD